MTSQNFDTYVPVFDAIPEKWEDAKDLLVERMKLHANGINIRSMGWMVDVEVLSGFQFIPVRNESISTQFRSVFRKVVDCGALTNGVTKNVPHGITFDVNFTLIDLWVAATNSVTFSAANIAPGNVSMDATNIIITPSANFDRSFAQVLYIQEL